jgi:Trk K+ transport system NAD-binding subunit
MQNVQKLKVLIIGAGEVGAKAAAQLSEHDEIQVTLIERDPERSSYVRNNINCQHVFGSALEPHILKRAELLTSDLFYAVTDSDEVNVLACQLALEIMRRERVSHPSSPDLNDHLLDGESQSSSASDVLNQSRELPCAPLGESHERISIASRSESGELALFARMRSSALYEHLKHNFSETNILLPELACSRKLDELIHYQQLFDVIELEPDTLKLYGVKIHPKSSAVGQSLRQFTQDLKITVAAIARHVESSPLNLPDESTQSSHKHESYPWSHRRQLLIPWADYKMEPNDAVYFAASPSSLEKLHHHFCHLDRIGGEPLVIAGENEVVCDLFQRVVN